MPNACTKASRGAHAILCIVRRLLRVEPSSSLARAVGFPVSASNSALKAHAKPALTALLATVRARSKRELLEATAALQEAVRSSFLGELEDEGSSSSADENDALTLAAAVVSLSHDQQMSLGVELERRPLTQPPLPPPPQPTQPLVSSDGRAVSVVGQVLMPALVSGPLSGEHSVTDTACSLSRYAPSPLPPILPGLLPGHVVVAGAASCFSPRPAAAFAQGFGAGCLSPTTPCCVG